MVKLIKPGFSAEASGSLSDVLIFSKGKKSAYAKTYAKPTVTHTDAQVSTRLLQLFISVYWSQLSSADMSTWFDRAQQNHIANYHAYLKGNGIRWANFNYPSKQDPATEAGTQPAGPSFTLWVTGNTANCRIHPPAGVFPWGLAFYRSQTSGFTPSRNNLRQLKLQEGAITVDWSDRNLPTGTYYYRVLPFTATGLQGGWSAQRTAVIT